MPLTIKICGVTTQEAVCAAADAGADMIGFVFFPRSPRNVSISQACDLSARLGERVRKVALVVNADDDLLDDIVQAFKPDWLQLHGVEPAKRVGDIRKKFGVPILKAVGIAEPSDLAEVDAYLGVADSLLLDAKPTKGAELPGGNGLAFDWTLTEGFSERTAGAQWMLSGGLNAENVDAAIRLTHAPGVDVSSGVEDSPGRKSVEKIWAFVAAARRAQDQLGLTAGSV
jgi:phosphoribosylanthranilate isomerase